MLVLCRKEGEQIVCRIDGKVILRLSVEKIIGQKIKLGIEAGPEIEVHRGEVDEKIHGETCSVLTA